jgi:two-component system chemotaxis response regulator CheY
MPEKLAVHAGRGGAQSLMESLIIEDVPSVRLLLRATLSQFGHCDEAPDGAAALEALQVRFHANRPYDLICLDLGLPELSGIEVLKYVRRMEAGRRMERKRDVAVLTGDARRENPARVLVISGASNEEAIDKARMAGADGFLMKPLNLKKVCEFLVDAGLASPAGRGEHAVGESAATQSTAGI